ncbi:MAG: hypothetical protein AAB798_02135 [Patescibacteria group bacterium]
MKCTQKQFEEMRRNGTLRLAFIGMSNIGKSHISKHLATKMGFGRIEIDEAIGKHLSLQSISSVAEWLGYPDSATYAEREAQYLSYEAEETRRAMHELNAPSTLDTTGSVIYMPEELLRSLKENWLIINFSVNEKDVDELFRIFIAEPKPIIWSGMFRHDAGEQFDTALEKSYRSLLADRNKRYRELADVTVNRFAMYRAKTGNAILDVIGEALTR